MSKDITLNDNTYSGVSAIQIGTARFIEESEASISTQTFTIDQEYSDSSANGVKWLIETYFESLTDGIYIAKALNNTGFENSSKEQYALEYIVFVKHGDSYGGTLWRTSGSAMFTNGLSNQNVAYLAQGATLKTTKISEESI